MYNLELTNTIAIVATFSIIIYVFSCLLYGMISDNVKPFKFSDKFDLGYIEDREETPVTPSNTVVTVSKVAKKKSIPQKPKTTREHLVISKMEKQLNALQSKLTKLEKEKKNIVSNTKIKKSAPKKVEPKKAEPKDTRLFDECVSVLMTLGYKRRTIAKRDVEEFLSNNNISSTEQFLEEFFKRKKI